eukprot:m.305461 g.305461  ORF g.305461 m.305461 type:complete len:440 (+) comp17906_c0_seq1:181-1500(+)
MSARRPVSRVAPQDQDTAGAGVRAAALQDHLVRQLGLDGPAIPRSRPRASTTRRKTATMIKRDVSKPRILYAPPSPTLAQRLQLVPGVEAKLKPDEWHAIRTKSSGRSDSTLPCPICREVFGLREQILLSCSHVFHRHCLQAFERFIGKRTCPLCRKEQYQACLISDGALAFRHQCAARIQAAWRGHRARRAYIELRDSPAAPQNADPAVKRLVAARKVTGLTHKLAAETRQRADSVDSFLREIDSSMGATRSKLDSAIEAILKDPSDDRWLEIHSSFMARGSLDCPVCLSPFEAARETALLSCSHAFHACCLQAFESYALLKFPGCPVCRSLYIKRALVHHDDPFSLAIKASTSETTKENLPELPAQAAAKSPRTASPRGHLPRVQTTSRRAGAAEPPCPSRPQNARLLPGRRTKTATYRTPPLPSSPSRPAKSRRNT